jgi:pimeloyl-ACP methyl ester carboxylesterase
MINTRVWPKDTRMTTPRSGEVRCLSDAGFHSMRYVEWGAHDNPRVVICVHGLTRQGRDFDVLAQRLASTHRVICPDVVGRGQSDWLRDRKGYQYPQYVRDMATLLASLQVSHVDWVGTSMGGIIGMALAAMPGTPLQRLVLNDVGTRIPKAALERIGQYVGRDPVFESMDAFLGFMKLLSPFGPMTDADWLHFAVHQAKVAPDGSVSSRYDPAIGDAYRDATQGKPIEDIHLDPFWNALSIPVLVIRGSTSDLLLPEDFTAMCRKPQVTGYVANDCGHAPSLTRASEVEAIAAFLNPAV